jgi:hypothetical protein
VIVAVTTTANSTTTRVIAIVAVIGALLSLLLFIRIASTDAWIRVGLDASHGPIFAGVAMLLAVLVRTANRAARGTAWPDWLCWAKVLALCITLGALIEFLQGFEGRPPSFFDVMTDTAGALVGLTLWALAIRARAMGRDTGSRSRLSTVIALGLAGLTFVLWRPLHAAAAYAHRAQVFPAIAEFREPLDLYFTTTDGAGAAIAEIPARWSRQPGEKALELRYDPQHPPAVQVVEPSGDWRDYGVIAVDLTNAGRQRCRSSSGSSTPATTGRTRTGSTCPWSSRPGRGRRSG